MPTPAVHMKRGSSATHSAAAAGAERELWRAANTAPADEREDLLLEAYEVAHALLTRHPELSSHRPFLDRIGAEITKSE